MSDEAAQSKQVTNRDERRARRQVTSLCSRRPNVSLPFSGACRPLFMQKQMADQISRTPMVGHWTVGGEWWGWMGLSGRAGTPAADLPLPADTRGNLPTLMNQATIRTTMEKNDTTSNLQTRLPLSVPSPALRAARYLEQLGTYAMGSGRIITALAFLLLAQAASGALRKPWMSGVS